jgi:hypothetical protein
MNEQTLTDLWADKSDDQIRMALRDLIEYDPAAQRIIRREAESRPAIDVPTELLHGDRRRRMTDERLMAQLSEPEADLTTRELARDEARRRSEVRFSGVSRTELQAIGLKLLGIYFAVIGSAEVINFVVSIMPEYGDPRMRVPGVPTLPVLVSRAVLKSLCYVAVGAWLIWTGNKELERKGRDGGSEPENSDDLR